MQDLNTSSRTKGKFASTFAHLMVKMATCPDHACNRPDNLKQRVAQISPQFAGYGQHDSQEFLRFLMDGLHDDLNRIKNKPPYEEIKDGKNDTNETKSLRWWKNYTDRNNSIFTDIFCGQLSSTIVCEECGHTSTAFDPFWDLSLPIPKRFTKKSGFRSRYSTSYGDEEPRATELAKPARGEFNTSGKCSLLDCFAEFTKAELLADNNQVYCSQCKTHRDCTKQLALYRFPEILVIHIKRFTHRAYSRSKLNTEISFPSYLDLTDLIADPRISRRSSPPIYGLYAVSNHMGGTGGGHYTAHCNTSTSRDLSEWHTFNDSHVSQADPSRLGGASAYVLFYTKVRSKS